MRGCSRLFDSRRPQERRGWGAVQLWFFTGQTLLAFPHHTSIVLERLRALMFHVRVIAFLPVNVRHTPLRRPLWRNAFGLRSVRPVFAHLAAVVLGLGSGGDRCLDRLAPSLSHKPAARLKLFRLAGWW